MSNNRKKPICATLLPDFATVAMMMMVVRYKLLCKEVYPKTAITLARVVRHY